MAKQAGKGVAEFRPYVTRAIPIGAQIVCADNTGAKILEIVMVQRQDRKSTRLNSSHIQKSRMPSSA